MARLDQLGAELQEVGQQQQADVHAVNIGIGGDDDLVVTQAFNAVLDIECRLQHGKLRIDDDLLGVEAVGVQRLTAQREDSLRLYVADLGDGAACTQTLSDEDAGLVATVIVLWGS